MADNDKMQTRAVFNRSVHGRVYHLRDGRTLSPGETKDVSPKEHESLIQYKDLIDANKLVPAQRDRLKAALAENDELRGKLEEAVAKGTEADDLRKQIEELQAKLKKGKGNKED